MSNDAMNRVWANQTIKGANRMVLASLADHADKKHLVCWPSQAMIMEWTCLGERTVRNAINELIKAGAIIEASVGCGRGRITYYCVLIGLSSDERKQHMTWFQNHYGNGAQVAAFDDGNGAQVAPFGGNGANDDTEMGQTTTRKWGKRRHADEAPFAPSQSAQSPPALQYNPHGNPQVNHGGGHARTRANAASPKLPEPPPPPGWTTDLEATAADWLHPNQPLTPGERKKLLALLAQYGADWLASGVDAAIAQGGKTLAYLEKMLQGCTRDGQPPGHPKPKRQSGQVQYVVPAQPKKDVLTPEQRRNLMRQYRDGNAQQQPDAPPTASGNQR